MLATICLLSQGTFAQTALDHTTFALGGGGQPSCSVAQSTFDPVQLDAYIRRMMKEYGVPGVGLAVIENGNIRYVKGYGIRDVKTRAPVTVNTQFAIGSVTKSFTALDMMVLVEDGLVDLDAPVTTYIPEFKLANLVSTRTVTVRNLLTHSTGLVRTDASTFNPKLTAKDIIAAAASTPLVGKPGETFVYSNVNTIIAGEIISRVSGQPWQVFTRQRVLQPLGMNTATLSIENLKKQPDIAVAHELNVKGGGSQPTDYLTLGADAPAGAVNASAAEMARYVRFQLGDGSPLLSQASLNEMHQGQVAAPDFNLPGIFADQARKVAARPSDVPASLVTGERYGFYWGVETFLGETLVQHGGNVTGETANITLLPKRRSGVVILANVEGANTFMEAVRLHVAKVLLGCPGPDVNAVLQAQLKLLGQDNVSIAADRLAARTYQPHASELSVLVGSYKSLADSKPTQITAVDSRTLKLESGFQGVRFAVNLLPLGKNRFMATSQPLIGGVIKFVDRNEKRTIELEGLTGPIPLAVSDQ
ncbi:serine hydrolase domain-containing protein [Deinococcus sp. Arct2-2]|uniref:serine hydrolase domain-containing protein n=1 Tax=Deinococcus sp. Arct2-2 TaxID=2568653 RepID=UPI001454BC86|nr:serine hydrolase domain-containing protein [Deinococcus sp. Arct2-2]